ncbi:hypothetical protein DFH09DRAFT_1278499 [Mycena vulgaris]|nr:hypothetical protein DFH09DRAFT_1278499 [Mycena vulgaris]
MPAPPRLFRSSPDTHAHQGRWGACNYREQPVREDSPHSMLRAAVVKIRGLSPGFIWGRGEAPRGRLGANFTISGLIAGGIMGCKRLGLTMKPQINIYRLISSGIIVKLRIKSLLFVLAAVLPAISPSDWKPGVFVRRRITKCCRSFAYVAQSPRETTQSRGQQFKDRVNGGRRVGTFNSSEKPLERRAESHLGVDVVYVFNCAWFIVGDREGGLGAVKSTGTIMLLNLKLLEPTTRCIQAHAFGELFFAPRNNEVVRLDAWNPWSKQAFQTRSDSRKLGPFLASSHSESSESFSASDSPETSVTGGVVYPSGVC